MKNLPFEIAFFVCDKKVKIFHATPLKNNLYWHSDRDEDFFLHMARKAEADIMIYGHTHIPYIKKMNNKVFINAGSVGKPKDGDTRACVCIVDIIPDNVTTEFLRIPYNIEKVASAIVESGLPHYFAEKLRAGK
jgi:putative phosphoesterase